MLVNIWLVRKILCWIFLDRFFIVLGLDRLSLVFFLEKELRVLLSMVVMGLVRRVEDNEFMVEEVMLGDWRR